LTKIKPIAAVLLAVAGKASAVNVLNTIGPKKNFQAVISPKTPKKPATAPLPISSMSSNRKEAFFCGNRLLTERDAKEARARHAPIRKLSALLGGTPYWNVFTFCSLFLTICGLRNLSLR
jgi:hypothetical protein